MLRYSKFPNNRYLDTKMTNERIFAMCPYNLKHISTSFAKNLKVINKIKFKKWVKRSNKAYILYWKLHLKEYNSMF